MAKHVNVDELLNKLPDDLPYKSSVKRVLIQAPTTDVVPKSEVDKWYHEYHVIKDALTQEKMYHRETEKLADKYCAELQTAKTEVAREIFEEIDEIFKNSNQAEYSKELKCIARWSFDKVKFLKQLAELKKKYTEGECPACKHFVGCEPSTLGACDGYEEGEG